MADDSSGSLGDEDTDPTKTVDVDTSVVFEEFDSIFALSVVAGCDAGKTTRFDENDLTLGRSSEVDLCLEDPGISKRHCRIYRHDRSVFLEDLDSSNGTVVNGERIHSPHELEDGDAIALGEETLVRVAALEETPFDEREVAADVSEPKMNLAVGRKANWFQAGDGDPVDLRRRGSIRRILHALLERSDEDEMLSVHELFDIGWPDQSVDPDLAAKRVYWAIRTLRDEGLRGLLITSDDGYFIPSDLVSVDWHPTEIQPPDE